VEFFSLKEKSLPKFNKNTEEEASATYKYFLFEERITRLGGQTAYGPPHSTTEDNILDKCD